MNDRTKFRKKRIQEVSIGKKIPGTNIIAREYWDFMAANHTGSGENGGEDPLANPDVLSADADVFDRPLTEQGELQIEAVHQTLAELTPLQQRIVRLSFDGVWSEKEGQRLYTEQAIADATGVTRSTVQTLFRRIKAKIRQRYEKLRAAKD